MFELHELSLALEEEMKEDYVDDVVIHPFDDPQPDTEAVVFAPPPKNIPMLPLEEEMKEDYNDEDGVNPFDEPQSDTLDAVFAPSQLLQNQTMDDEGKQIDILDEVFAGFSPGDVPPKASAIICIEQEEEGDVLNLIFGPLHNAIMRHGDGDDVGVVCVGSYTEEEAKTCEEIEYTLSSTAFSG